MRVLLLSSYCDEDGCCDELPCENCLTRCNVVEINGNFTVEGRGESYEGLRAMVKEDNALDEEAARHHCDTVSCDMCPYEDKCLGEE